MPMPMPAMIAQRSRGSRRNRPTAAVAASAAVSVAVCVMRFIDMNSCQGDSANSRRAIRAVPRGYSPRSTVCASRTLSPPSSGLKNHVIPSAAAPASRNGHPGFTGENHRCAWYIIRSTSNGAWTGGSGIASRPFAR